MANPIVHFELIGPDGPALQRYYGELFGWEIDADNPWQYGVVHAGDEGIGGGIGADPQGSNRVTVYAEVDDLQATLDRAEQLGGKTVMPPSDMGDFAIALFLDPAGNVAGLMRRAGEPR